MRTYTHILATTNWPNIRAQNVIADSTIINSYMTRVKCPCKVVLLLLQLQVKDTERRTLSTIVSCHWNPCTLCCRLAGEDLPCDSRVITVITVTAKLLLRNMCKIFSNTHKNTHTITESYWTYIVPYFLPSQYKGIEFTTQIKKCTHGALLRCQYVNICVTKYVNMCHKCIIMRQTNRVWFVCGLK